jgi:hypothetical protein
MVANFRDHFKGLAVTTIHQEQGVQRGVGYRPRSGWH